MELRKLHKFLAEEEDRDRNHAKEAFGVEAVAANAGEWSHGAEGEGLHSQRDGDTEDQQDDQHHQPDEHHQQDDEHYRILQMREEGDHFGRVGLGVNLQGGGAVIFCQRERACDQ